MIINLKSETDLSGFYVVYNGSTNFEKPGWRGLSHLMEHLVCKSFDHLQDEFDRDGISYNAYTSSNEIVFFLTGLDEKVKKWRNEFINLLTDFQITKEEFENERKIVLEEYSDSFNSQTSAHFMNLNRKLFNNFSPIGNKEDLEKLTYMDILNYFELQFTNPSKIINVSKHSEYKNNLINFDNKRVLNNLEYGNFDVPYELDNEFKGKSSIIIASPVIREDFAYVKFINLMLGYGLTSPLYQEIREKKGLVYYVHISLSRMAENGINYISTQTSDGNYDEVVNTIKMVFKNPKKYLTKSRFDIVKDLCKTNIKKEEILRYDSVNKWIEPEGFSIESILDKVDMKKINEVYKKYFNIEDYYISNDKQEFK